MNNNKRYINATIITLVFLILGLLCEWKGNILQFPETRKIYLYLLPVFGILMIIAHGSNIGDLSLKEYIKKILVGNIVSGKRLIYLDYARVLAVICIILTHACSSQVTAVAEDWKISLLTVITSITLVCNPLYVMISGALILSSNKKESLLSFYYKRVIKVFIPAFIIYFLFLVIANRVDIKDFSSIIAGIKEIFKGPDDLVPHYWFIYMIMGLYILTPLLRVILDKLSDRILYILFLLIIIFEGVRCLGPLINVIPVSKYEVERWTGVFVIGYIIVNRANKKLDIVILISGFVCGIITIINALLNNPAHIILHNYSPVSVLFAAAIIIALKKSENILRKIPKEIVLSFSKYSFMMVILHWYVLFCITKLQLGIQPLRFGCIGGIAATLLSTFVISYILALVAENTIIMSVTGIRLNICLKK